MDILGNELLMRQKPCSIQNAARRAINQGPSSKNS